MGLEIWLDIVGFEKLYQVNQLGSIRSLSRTYYDSIGRHKTHIGCVIVPRFDRYGYLRVGFHKNGKLKTISVHRAVASTFIPNPKGKKTINHKDGNKLNNHISNLEWNSFSENTKHAWKNGLIKTKKIGSRSLGRKVYCTKTGKQWNSISVCAEELGIPKSNLFGYLKGVCFNKTSISYVSKAHVE